jgi:uncharacterized protein YdeI (BOF family)
MKKNLLILVFSLFSLNSYANNIQSDTVVVAESKFHNSNTVLAGIITKVINKDEFILKDHTGEIKIRIDLLSNAEKSAFFKKYPNLVGANVVVEGNLDKKIVDETKVSVKKIELVYPNTVDSFSSVINGDLSHVKNIKFAKSLEHQSQIILYGVVVQILGDYEFLLRDNEGSDIKITLDFPVKDDEVIFMKEYGTQLKGSTVVLEGFLDKEFVQKIKVNVNRIQIITRFANDPFADTVNKAKSTIN